MYRLIIISIEYERLSDRRFCALKYNIALQGFYFSSGGFCVCYSITILFIYKVLLYVMFKGFKAVGVVHDVVACKDNNKVIDAGTTELLTGLLIGLLIVLLVWMVLWIECG